MKNQIYKTVVACAAVFSLWTWLSYSMIYPSQSRASASLQSENCKSLTGQSYLCDARQNSAGSFIVNELATCKVAVFDAETIAIAQDLANVLNTNPSIQATAVTQQEIESGVLSSFDTLVVRLIQAPPSVALSNAIQSFVQNGGGYVGEWWGAGGALSSLGTPVNFNYAPPQQFFGFFTGQASDGFLITTNHPITVTVNHPVTQGLPGVFAAEGGTEFFVRAIPPFDPNLTTLATYEGYGGTQSAIMAGNIGIAKALLIFFDAIDNPSNANLRQLWINSVLYTCGELNDVFDTCIQQDNGSLFLINTQTGAYQFTNCRDFTIGGTGNITTKGCYITLSHNTSDRRVLARLDKCGKSGTASVQSLATGRTFTISDRNIANNTCSCTINN